jgi:exonuclease III
LYLPGYTWTFHNAETAGYAGTAVGIREDCRAETTNLPHKDGRVQFTQLTHPINASVLSMYSTNAGWELQRLDQALQFDRELTAIIQEYQPSIAIGDFNRTLNYTTDLHENLRKDAAKTPSLTQEEQDSFNQLLTDTSYSRIPTVGSKEYSFYIHEGHFKKNIGMTLDHAIAPRSADRGAVATVIANPRHRDHMILLVPLIGTGHNGRDNMSK